MNRLLCFISGIDDILLECELVSKLGATITMFWVRLFCSFLLNRKIQPYIGLVALDTASADAYVDDMLEIGKVHSNNNTGGCLRAGEWGPNRARSILI